ncbi:ribosomal protein S18 acetylase RimI-like enzyme [Nocardioides daedukensis]|uniref:Ribosomal protein S18 acetylase RimI-like enzyme n=1 Tax=Nocardioides daedukensis TaxID=634462 RepID=A0A7Y9S5M4_9ACTN|nr:GNAT family N-acetyltransferase [Nocardioides daedukensis]NYG60423.1 ribosomal protein S18 acetylase RimI-like enzyme [Nocardioides daedukensis]
MDSRPDSQVVGKHLLGPHVVGQRVVVRRLVPGETGPTGGPAFTDVLGTCTSWGEGTCVVAPESGPEVAIPIAEIVSGKPVPPRPSVRHRVSPREAEGHALVLWPHVERRSLGDWELRSDPAPVGRLLKRANSCLAMGDPGSSLAEAEQEVRAFYASRDRAVLLQVETDSAVEAHFLAAGWSVVEGGSAHFQIASLSRTARLLRTVTTWGPTDDPEGDVDGMQITEDGPRLELTITVDGEVMASARAGISGDWMGIHAFGVVPQLRRRGVARRMIAELVDRAAEQGVTTLWLHVEVDNAPALALYESLGFSTHHSLAYLSPPS